MAMYTQLFGALLYVAILSVSGVALGQAVVDIKLADAQLRVGDPLFVRVRVRNEGGVVLEYPVPIGTRFSTIRFLVRAVGGDWDSVGARYQGVSACVWSAEPYRIEPGATIAVHECLWRRGFLEAPGEYDIRATVQLGDMRVMSAPVPVTVRESLFPDTLVIDGYLDVLEQMVGTSSHTSASRFDAKTLKTIRRELNPTGLRDSVDQALALSALWEATDREAEKAAEKDIDAIVDDADPILAEILDIHTAKVYLRRGRLAEALQRLRAIRTSSEDRDAVLREVEAQIRHKKEREQREATENNGPKAGVLTSLNLGADVALNPVVELAPSDANLQAGDPLYLRVTVRNEGKTPLAVSDAVETYFNTIRFFVRSPHGNWHFVPTADQGGADCAVSSPGKLPPGEAVIEHEYFWNLRFLNTPGDYQIRADVEYGKAFVESRPIDISVREGPGNDPVAIDAHRDVLQAITDTRHWKGFPHVNRKAVAAAREALTEGGVRATLDRALALFDLDRADDDAQEQAVQERIDALRADTDEVTAEVFDLLTAEVYLNKGSFRRSQELLDTIDVPTRRRDNLRSRVAHELKTEELIEEQFRKSLQNPSN